MRYSSIIIFFKAGLFIATAGASVAALAAIISWCRRRWCSCWFWYDWQVKFVSQIVIG